MRRMLFTAGAATVAVAATVLAQPAMAEVITARTTTTAPATEAGAVPAAYLSQTIAWKPCFPTGAPAVYPAGSERLECGSFKTPRDWAQPNAGVDLDIAVSRLVPQGKTPTGSVLTNPGGPGAPGVDMPVFWLEAKDSKVAAERELIGIDVRGTGESTNVTCGFTAEGAPLDPRDRSKANIKAILAEARSAADKCQKQHGDLTRYITTEQTVRDYDLLRALLQRETIDWVGYSSGTWLGAAYATYFPHRVGKFVLDSNTDFTAPWQRTWDLTPKAMERRLRVDYFPWVAKYHTVFGLGDTAKKVSASYEALRRQVARKPVTVTVGEGAQAVTIDVNPFALDGMIANGLYSKAAFEATTQMWLLAQAEADKDVPQKLVAAAERRLSLPEAKVLAEAAESAITPLGTAEDAFDAVFTNITCNDTRWTDTPKSLVRKSGEMLRRYPFQGGTSLNNPCAFWDRTGLTELAPRTGRGVPNVLMVQSERDNATAAELAFSARKRFAGARMLFVRDEGDHGVYLGGNECVDTKVEAFILGQAPAADAVCDGIELPVPEGAKGSAEQRSDRVAASILARARAWAAVAGR